MKIGKKKLAITALSLMTMSTLVSPLNVLQPVLANEDIQVIQGEVYSGTGSVDSLTIQPGTTTSSINLNWYVGKDNTGVKLKFGDKLYDVTPVSLTDPTVVVESKYKDTNELACKITIDNLEANTKYMYQISSDNGNTWSKEYSYQTPDTDSFSFGFTSDPQIKESGESNANGWNSSDGTNQTGWATMMQELAEQDVNLVVSAGDQVEDQSWGKSSEYDAFFAPEEMSSIAYAPAVGNHDRHYMFLTLEILISIQKEI